MWTIDLRCKAILLQANFLTDSSNTTHTHTINKSLPAIRYSLTMLQAENNSQITELASIKAWLSAISVCLNLHFPLKFHFRVSAFIFGSPV